MDVRQTPSPDAAFRSAGHAAVDLIAGYLETIRDRPVYQPVPAPHRKHLMGIPLADDGRSLDELVSQFAEEILPYPMGNGHPRFSC